MRHAEKLLNDEAPVVLAAAAWAAGQLRAKATTGRLLQLVRHRDPQVQRECLIALRLLNDPSAAEQAVAALPDRTTRTAALVYLEVYGGPERVADVVTIAQKHHTRETISGVLRALVAWQSRAGGQAEEVRAAIASVQGSAGIAAVWRSAGPFDEQTARGAIQRLGKQQGGNDQPPPFHVTAWLRRHVAGETPRPSGVRQAVLAVLQ